MRRQALLGWLLGLLIVGVVPALAADEPLAVIVSPVHARSLNKEDLALIFKRKKQFWGDGSKLQPVNLSVAHPLRRMFSLAVLKSSPEELDKYWNGMYFHGISPPFVVSSEEAMLRFVAETPGAVGYVPFCHADHRVAVAFVMTPAGHVSDDTDSVSCPR